MEHTGTRCQWQGHVAEHGDHDYRSVCQREITVMWFVLWIRKDNSYWYVLQLQLSFLLVDLEMDLKTLRAWLTETDHKLFSMSSDFLKSDDELKECLDEHKVSIDFDRNDCFDKRSVNKETEPIL